MQSRQPNVKFSWRPDHACKSLQNQDVLILNPKTVL